MEGRERKKLVDYLMHGDLEGIIFRDNYSNELYKVTWIRSGKLHNKITDITMVGRQYPSGKELSSSVLSFRLDDSEVFEDEVYSETQKPEEGS